MRFLQVKDVLRRISLRRGFVVQVHMQLLFIKFTAPLANHHGGHAIADQVGQGAGFRHETVNPQDQRQTGNRQAADRRQRGCQHDETAAGDPGCPL